MEKVAVETGENCTPTTIEPPGTNVEPDVGTPMSAKGETKPESCPNVRGAVPVLLRVNVDVADVLIATFPKSIPPGLRLSNGATPVPAMGIVSAPALVSTATWLETNPVSGGVKVTVMVIDALPSLPTCLRHRSPAV